MGRWLSLVVFLVGGLVFADEAADIKTLKDRLYDDYVKAGTRSVAKELAALGADGLWPDIDYRDQSRNVWKPAAHFDRLAALAAAYRNTKNDLQGKPEVLEAVHRGLGAWFRLRLKADNWWFNTIGIPQKAMRVLVLLDSDLTPEDHARLLALLPDPAHVPAAVSTGENLVWHASEQLVRGVMKPDVADVVAASEYLQKDVRISTDEGIQPDGSFHQHGAQLYNGGYGYGFIQDSTYYAQLLAGTPWAFSKENLAVLAYYLLEGQRKMIRGTWFDDAARGREPSRPKTSATAPGLAVAAERLAALVPESADDLTAFARVLRQSQSLAANKMLDPAVLPPALWTGDAAFWRSDFMTHSRDGWYASVKMVSSRTIGTELVNGENLLGEWQSFGAARVARRGDEYADLYPVWDSARIPGVTAPHRVEALTSRVSQHATFVGSVSDGHIGLAAMELDKDGTRARKAWFLFDDGLVALGAGITSGTDEPVCTTLNQTNRQTTVVVDGTEDLRTGERILGPVRWVLHDETAYILDGKETVALSTGPATGSWKAINRDEPSDPVTRDLFCLWVDHGIRPRDGTYEYIVLPGADVGAAKFWATSPPVQVVRNTSELQAVHDNRDDTWALVFSRPGTVDIGSGRPLSVDRACLVLLIQDGHGLTVHLADPAQGRGVVHMILKETAGARILDLRLPEGGGEEGSTVQGRFP